ncbi:ABC transporter ATP-binding protein [Zobellella maritima]|uniref:ABC transporter ATP-binding protein n=1 Tax=Zobellella maritima TaxID=2059725 RepID=UPI000E3043D2|nr:ABC transporter ATP-binding protein [Zobellella maritima]
MAQISINRLRKAFGQTSVLKEIELTIRDGEFMTLIGPSGCGKSTLLRIIAGLESQTGGHIQIGEQVVDELRPKERNLAMVFQSYALYPHLTVFDNIATPLRMRNGSWFQRLPLIGRRLPGSAALAEEIEEKVAEVSSLLQIEHLLQRKPGELSGGQRQRVALGRAMVRSPAAFLMDEPLSNLDAKLRVHMRSEIAQLHRQLGSTFIYVTHDQAEAMTMSDRVALMMDGELLQVDTPDEIYRNPVDVRVAEFIGSPKINLLPATVSLCGRVALAGHLLPVSTDVGVGESVTLGIRPESAVICATEGGELSGRLTYLENMGGEYFVHVSVAELAAPLVVRCGVEQGQGLALEMSVGIRLKLDQALVFDSAGQRIDATRINREAADEQYQRRIA